MSDPLKDIDAASAGRNPQIEYWVKEIDLARKREKKWRKAAKECVELYEGDKTTENSFNILYSNTDTLLPACYNNLPRPAVDRRFQDVDPLGKFASKALERALSYLMDSADSKYRPFHALMQQAVLGGLVPGRGLTRFRYDPEFADLPDAVGDEESAGESAAGEAGEGTENEGAGEEIFPDPAESQQQVVYETICGEDVDYDSFIFGYARQWVDVPWIAFYHAMSKEDLEENFGEEIAAKVPLAEANRREDEDYRQSEGMDEGDNRGSVKTADVYEIWVKGDKKVLFYAPAYKDAFLRELDDPYNLSGFYPCPQPLQFLAKSSGLTPTPLFKLYEQQAKELNRLSMRINRVLNALKVRGFYDGSIQGLKDLLGADDNTLIAAKNVTALQDGKTIENSIWLMPLEKLITVLQQLLMGRESCKNTIYEITGIADIMRGDTQASETAAAQKIKVRWGTQRLGRMQESVQEYVRGCLRIMGEMAGEHFSLETFASMTGLPYALPEEIRQAQAMQQAMQQAMLQLPPPPMQAPGQPPAPPPQLPPQIQQAQQQIQAILSKPKWEDVVGLLRSDLQRYYRVDIETNSTMDATSAEDKQEMQDALTAISRTMDAFGPYVEKGIFPMPAFKEMLLSVTRRYEFGRQVEDTIAKIPDQVPPTKDNQPDPGPSPQEQQAMQAESMAKAQAAQIKMQTDKLEAAAKEQKLKLDAAAAQRADELAGVKHQLTMAQTQAKLQTVAAATEAALAKAEADKATAAASVEKAQIDVMLARIGVRKAEVTSAADEHNAGISKQKATRDLEVHSAQTKKAIAVANTPEPPAKAPEKPQDAELAKVVKDLLATISRPATITRDKATGKITVSRLGAVQ